MAAREYVKRRKQKCHLAYDSERMYCVSLEKYVECRMYSKNVLPTVSKRKESKPDLRNHNLLRHCFLNGALQYKLHTINTTGAARCQEQ
jgi:hypothetical protein